MRRFLPAILVALLFAPPVLAHPVPKSNRDRIIVVRVTKEALVVDFRLEIDEGSIPDELPRTESARVTTRAELLGTFSRVFADALGRTLDASLDGQELRFRCVGRKYTATDHVRCDYRFESPWKLNPDTEHSVKFHDASFNGDEI